MVSQPAASLPSDPSFAVVAPVARVGPNAIVQTGAALIALEGLATAQAVFERAGLADALIAPPAAMVAQTDAAKLHRAVTATLSDDRARAVAWEAGLRTGSYILAHRIPKPIKLLLAVMPARLAGRALVSNIERHAWTFAGSGRVTARAGDPAVIEIKDNPLATPDCPWHAAVFTRLFQTLVSTRASVRSTACCARGDPACRFDIRLSRP